MPEAPPFRVRASAPLRVELAGGGTDVEPFASRYGGAAVGVAISLSAQVEVRLGGNTIRLRSEDRDRRATVSHPSAIAYDGTLDAPKAALNMLPVTGGIEILTRCDAPAGAGLGERAVLNVALLAALAHCRKERYDAAELAELAFQLETQELKRPGGRLDPCLAAMGGMQAVEVGDDRYRARSLALDGDQISECGRHLLVVYLGRAYAAESAAQRAREAVTGGEEDVIEALTGLRDLVAPLMEYCERGEWRRLGALFDDAARHAGVLDPVWSAPPTARLTAALRAAGAWGVKPAGPRAGGSLLAVLPPEHRAGIAAAAREHGGVILDCTLANQGVSVWREDLPQD